MLLYSSQVSFIHRCQAGIKGVAERLNDARLATLLLDLFPTKDIELKEPTQDLSQSLIEIIDWLITSEQAQGLFIGLLGIHSGAAASVLAASRREKWLNAIVSCSGRFAEVAQEIAAISTPLMLLCGEDDNQTIRDNQEVLQTLTAPRELVFIPGAIFPFEEQLALEQVSGMCVKWFERYLC